MPGERCEPGTQDWGAIMGDAFNELMQPGALATTPPPAWWKNDQLLLLSKVVVEAAPSTSNAWKMRAEVLAGLLSQIECKRTPEQLQEWYQVFHAYDRDGGGDVSTTELGLMLRAVGERGRRVLGGATRAIELFRRHAARGQRACDQRRGPGRRGRVGRASAGGECNCPHQPERR